jgi:hypothetical protein
LSYQNLPKNEILIYSIDSQCLIKRLCINTEGDNSVVGGFGGYYIADMQHIFIPSMYVNTIFVVDTVGKVRRKITYEKTRDNQELKPFMLSDRSQMVFIGNKFNLSKIVYIMI